MSPSPVTAVAYLRVSTDEQHLGPDAQRASIGAWSAREGAVVVAWHEDFGVSGGAPLEERPGLLHALDALTPGSVLVVARRDRLARDVFVAAVIERAVARRRARVVSADGVANGDTPADAFLRTVLDGAAAYERGLIRRRTSDALQAKRRRGERAGTVPWGWTADEHGRLAPARAELETAARIVALRNAGASLREIARVLDDEQRRTRTGGKIQPNQIRRILATVQSNGRNGT